MFSKLFHRAVEFVCSNIKLTTTFIVTAVLTCIKPILLMIWSFWSTVISTSVNFMGFTVPVMPTITATVQQWFNWANYFFPLDTLIAMSASLGVIWGGCWAYRLTKSWIPTAS